MIYSSLVFVPVTSQQTTLFSGEKFRSGVMRYFFHVRSNAEAFDDDVGETFSDANQAIFKRLSSQARSHRTTTGRRFR